MQLSDDLIYDLHIFSSSTQVCGLLGIGTYAALHSAFMTLVGAFAPMEPFSSIIVGRHVYVPLETEPPFLPQRRSVPQHWIIQFNPPTMPSTPGMPYSSIAVGWYTYVPLEKKPPLRPQLLSVPQGNVPCEFRERALAACRSKSSGIALRPERPFPSSCHHPELMNEPVDIPGVEAECDDEGQLTHPRRKKRHAW